MKPKERIEKQCKKEGYSYQDFYIKFLELTNFSLESLTDNGLEKLSNLIQKHGVEQGIQAWRFFTFEILYTSKH